MKEVPNTEQGAVGVASVDPRVPRRPAYGRGLERGARCTAEVGEGGSSAHWAGGVELAGPPLSSLELLSCGDQELERECMSA